MAAITIIALCMKPSVPKRAAAGLASFQAAQRDYSTAKYKPAESEARRAVKLFGQLAREVPRRKDFRVQLGHAKLQQGFLDGKSCERAMEATAPLMVLSCQNSVCFF